MVWAALAVFQTSNAAAGSVVIFSAFGSHKVASGLDDDQGGNAVDSKLLLEESNAGIIVVRYCESGHFNKVSFVGFCVTVNLDGNYLEDFALRVYFKAPFSKFRDEKVAWRGPCELRSRDQLACRKTLGLLPLTRWFSFLF